MATDTLTDASQNSVVFFGYLNIADYLNVQDSNVVLLKPIGYKELVNNVLRVTFDMYQPTTFDTLTVSGFQLGPPTGTKKLRANRHYDWIALWPPASNS